MGYKNLKESILVDGEGEASSIYNHTLLADALLLEAATVQESRVKVQTDKTTYSILPSDIKAAPSALELTTIVPQVIYDPVSEKISSASGMAVKILINGMNANEIELKTIKPEHIARIDHYDIPPARYSEYGSVLNIITKVREDGIAAGGNLSTAFNTGFGNEMLYLKYNKGRNQIGADYSLYHRNYKKNFIETSYDYMFGGTRMQREQKSKSAFGYNDNKSMIVIGVRYNLFRGKKYNEKASKLQNADRDTGMFLEPPLHKKKRLTKKQLVSFIIVSVICISTENPPHLGWVPSLFGSQCFP